MGDVAIHKDCLLQNLQVRQPLRHLVSTHKLNCHASVAGCGQVQARRRLGASASAAARLQLVLVAVTLRGGLENAASQVCGCQQLAEAHK